MSDEKAPVASAADGRSAARALAAGALAVAILALPYLGFLGSHRLWPPYEPEVVETAREMGASGNFIVPRFNGQPYPEKPPLYHWSALLAAAARGRLDETAARLPSAISLLLLVFVTAAFGTRVLGWRAGLLAGLILGTMPLAFLCGTAGMCDMPLALSVASAIFLVFLATNEDRPRGWALVAAGALAGVSVVAKSLVGPALIFLGTVPAIAANPDRRLPRPHWWILGVLAFVGAAVPWYVAVGQTVGRDFVFSILVFQTFERFLGHGDSKGIILNYLLTVPGDVFPWTLFLPLAVVHARRVRREDPVRWRALRFWLVGTSVQFVFLSISACRIGKYALPLFPQFALGIASALDDETLDRRFVTVPVIAVAVVAAIGAPVVPYVIGRTAPAVAGVVGGAVALGLVGALALYLVARTARPTTIAVTMALVFACAAVFTGGWLYPEMDAIRNDRPLEEAIVRNVAPGESYASYGLGARAYLLYYTERTCVEFFGRDDLVRWLESPPRTAYILTRDDYYK
ncbi:MAG TPA: glycosyltransferase family 39 protein, partial [Planctomycetota bacterium]|nr:glycosyltransferase family 39 protein [Planctomycetota bacterium]